MGHQLRKHGRICEVNGQELLPDWFSRGGSIQGDACFQLGDADGLWKERTLGVRASFIHACRGRCWRLGSHPEYGSAVRCREVGEGSVVGRKVTGNTDS